MKVKSGEAKGSTPTAGDGFKFVGWYLDEACTQVANSTWVDANNKLVPQKNADGKNVGTTYYAKFEYDVADLVIEKKIDGTLYDENDVFIFTVTGAGINQKVVVKANTTVTIKGLKVGETYTITEDTSWSWRYTPDSVSKSIVLEPNSNNVTFTNSLTKDKWLSDDAYAKNIFGKDGLVRK